MTEEQIERWVEKVTDALDVAYLSSGMTRERYREALADIDRRAASMLRDATRGERS